MISTRAFTRVLLPSLGAWALLGCGSPGNYDTGGIFDLRRPSGRSRRLCVLWAAALALLVAAALFSWLVAVPFMRVRSRLEDEGNYGKGTLLLGIEDFGGPEEALAGLSIYYRAPKCLAARKYATVGLLTKCGPQAVPVLREALRDPNPFVRHLAVRSLLDVKAAGLHGEIVAVLLRDAKNEHPQIRRWAVFELARLKPPPPGTVDLLVGMIDDDGEFRLISGFPGHRPVKVREGVLCALAELGAKAGSAAPKVRAVVENEGEDVETRKIAAEALAKVAPALNPVPVPLQAVSVISYIDLDGPHPAPVWYAFSVYEGRTVSVRGVVTAPGMPLSLATAANTGLHKPPDPTKEATIPLTGLAPPGRGRPFTAVGRLVKDGKKYSLEVLEWGKDGK